MKTILRALALSATAGVALKAYSHHLIKEPIDGNQRKNVFDNRENYEHYVNYYYYDSSRQAYFLKEHYERELVDRFPGDIPIHNSYTDGFSTLYMDWDGENLSPTEHDFCGEPMWSRECYPIFTGNELTSSEERYIEETHRFTGYMFLPFDINVTSDPKVWENTPEVNRSLAIHSRSLHSGSAGAVSGRFFGLGHHFTGIFRNGYGYAAPHEFGHQFGVGHQYLTEGREFPPTYMQEYPRWMSVWNPGSSGMLQWTKGEYADSWWENTYLNGVPDPAGRTDSLQQIARYVGYRADDHAGFPEYATPLIPNLAVEGMIARNTDTDWFMLAAQDNSGLTISVEPDDIAWDGKILATLDVGIKLYDSNMNLVAESNPEDRISADLSLSAAQLQGFSSPFYLEVDGVGLGVPLQEPRWGYTDYGSLGPYKVSADFDAAEVVRDRHGMQVKMVDQFAGSMSDFNIIEPTTSTIASDFSDLRVSETRADVAYEIVSTIEIPPLPQGQTSNYEYTFELQTNAGAVGEMVLSHANGEVLKVTSADMQHPDRENININSLEDYAQLPPYEAESDYVKNAKNVRLAPGLYNLRVFYSNRAQSQVTPHLDLHYRSSEVSLRKFFKSLPEGILYQPQNTSLPEPTATPFPPTATPLPPVDDAYTLSWQRGGCNEHFSMLIDRTLDQTAASCGQACLSNINCSSFLIGRDDGDIKAGVCLHYNGQCTNNQDSRWDYYTVQGTAPTPDDGEMYEQGWQKGGCNEHFTSIVAQTQNESVESCAQACASNSNCKSFLVGRSDSRNRAGLCNLYSTQCTNNQDSSWDYFTLKE